MNLSIYQKESKRTCPSLGNMDLDLSHMILGMISELDEYDEAISKNDIVNVKEEIGDIFFYIANYCTFRNIDLDIIWEERHDEEYYGGIYPLLCKFSDLIKKKIVYKKPIDKVLETSILKKLLLMMELILSDNEMEYADLLRILAKNIDKLKIRYPDKFTEENAINRNLDKEREILNE